MVPLSSSADDLLLVWLSAFDSFWSTSKQSNVEPIKGICSTNNQPSVRNYAEKCWALNFTWRCSSQIPSILAWAPLTAQK